MKKIILAASTIVCLLASCHKDDVKTPDNTASDTEGSRLYILNQGNMTTNRASLDYLNLDSNLYVSNYYYTANNEALGDIGQDLLIYGGKMYISVNGSKKIVVVDTHNGKLLGEIAVTNSRYLTYWNGKVYASAFEDADYTTNASAAGAVVQIDTASLTITQTVKVGRQPEGIAAVNGKIYVANSGGYDAANYERTVSVIDPSTMTVSKNIDVAINLNLIKADSQGNLYIGSTGNYGDIAAKVFIVNTTTESVSDSLDIAASTFEIVHDTAYFLSSSYANGKTTASYLQYDCKNKVAITGQFISSDYAKNITVPYGITVDSTSGEIYIADAKNFKISGSVLRFDRKGNLLNTYTAGNIPCAMAILRK